MDKPDKPDPVSEVRPEDNRDRLLALLTPEGEKFSKRLEKALDEERQAVNNQAMEAVMAYIATMHMKTLDSIKAMNQLASSRAKARITAYYMIMNYANFLICSGQYSEGKGQLSRTGSHLLAIWRMYAIHLVDKREITQEVFDAEESKLKAKVAKMGKDGGIIKAVTAVFRKKK